MEIIPDKMINNPDGYPEELSRNEIDQRFREILGDFEMPSVPLNVRVTDEQELPGEVIQQRLEYEVDAGETVSAYHLFKKGLAKDAPGVLSIHGHGGSDIFPVGKDFHCHPDADDPMQYSYITALNDFRVLAPDALCFGERQSKFGYSTGFMDEVNTHSELTSRGKSFAWKSVWDNSRAIEVLEELGASSIGSIGWSGGSTQAYILASVNKKVQASACFFSFTTLRHQFYQFRGCHCLYHFIPGMMKAGIDWDQVVSLIAPRKILCAWGALDDGSPEPEYRAFVEAIEQRCKAESLPQSVFTCEELDKGHVITHKIINDSMEFLKKNLLV